jgi:UDP-N-acetylglucosamine 2-epimerase
MIVSVVGTRPQIIKASILSPLLERAGIDEFYIHTGQHFDYEMSQVFYDELGLMAPDLRLDVASMPDGAMVAEMTKQLAEVLGTLRPKAVLVYGDTNSALASALAAHRLLLPIFHVEAGPRCRDPRNNSEEMNRIIIDNLACMLFAPTKDAVENLREERVCGHVSLTGDLMLDAFLKFRGKAQYKNGDLPSEYFLVTIHRKENLLRLEEVLSFLPGNVMAKQIVWPIHPNTRKFLDKVTHGIGKEVFTLLPPVSYLEMLALQRGAKEIFTDSGGVQREAYFQKVPCTVLRDKSSWTAPIENQEDFGNGRAGYRIVDIIKGQI